jgi:hypothetical protein
MGDGDADQRGHGEGRDSGWHGMPHTGVLRQEMVISALRR